MKASPSLITSYFGRKCGKDEEILEKTQKWCAPQIFSSQFSVVGNISRQGEWMAASKWVTTALPPFDPKLSPCGILTRSASARTKRRQRTIVLILATGEILWRRRALIDANSLEPDWRLPPASLRRRGEDFRTKRVPANRLD
jgi:hypothetical protein